MHTDRARRWKYRAWGLGVAAATLALLVVTEPKLAIVWDEGYTLGRESRVRQWFQAVRDPAGFAETWVPPQFELVQQDAIRPPRRDQVDTRAKLFAPATLAWFWPFAREEPHGHPPFYALAGLIGDFVVPGWAELPRARFGPILAFAVTAGCLFGFVGRRWGAWAGAGSAGAWVLQPRLFGHGHYAAYDALLTCLWVSATLAFWLAIEPNEDGSLRNRPRWGWAIIVGVLLGWAGVTKFTGWFLPLPFVVWAGLFRKYRAERVAWAAIPVGILTLYLFNPGWWADPVGGVERFLRSNLTRGRTIPIAVQFLGTVYRTPIESLPSYNTLVWTVLVTPAIFLTLAILGGIRAVRRVKSEPFGLLVLGHWTMLILLRALPHTPGHDGVRLFLPAFGVLAILAGLGAASAVGRWVRFGRIIVVAALLEGAASLAIMMPVPLAYYSPIVGGLPGATALGMEPTYYWDALSDDALAFLNANTAVGESIRFAGVPTSFFYLRSIGRLKPSFSPFDPGKPVWLVLQNRPGSLRPEERALIDRGPIGYVERKLGVPLVWIVRIDGSRWEEGKKR